MLEKSWSVLYKLDKINLYLKKLIVKYFSQYLKIYSADSIFKI